PDPAPLMAIGAPVVVAEELPVGRRRAWVAAIGEFARRRALGAAGAVLILIMAVLAVSAPVLAPYDPLRTAYGAMPAAPSGTPWLGTDAFGRDVLSRLIYGSRTALLVGFGASIIGATLGAVLGVASAYFGGRTDLLVQRVMDIFLSFPLIIL